MDLSLFVRPGDKLTAELWNKLVLAVKACTIWPGNGTRIRRTPDGTTISASFSDDWSHPFYVTYSGNSCTVSKGLIDGIEPTINGTPISGDPKNKKPIPVLDVNHPKLDKDGHGWVAIEIEVDAEKWKTTKATIVQVDNLKAGTKLKGRHPLAFLTQNEDETIASFQVEFFNLQHRTDGRDKTPTHHFFWPV